tara:strand:- start:6183 stop:7121 length:939 start_codon:yes stop_codon:yes gene_type:complete
MKILITGGAGYIGSRLIEFLFAKDKKFKITVLDNLQYTGSSIIQFCSNKNFSFIRGDVSDPKIIKNLLLSHDVIIPLAAIVGAPACDLNPSSAKSTNLDAIKLLVENISSSQKLIYPTTNSGYGIGDLDGYCTEETPLNPISLYGTTKSDAEKIILDSGKGVCFRLATVFGTSPRMRWDLLVNDFCLKAYQDNCLVLFEENFRRNFIHVKDVCNAFFFSLQNYTEMIGETFNLGLSSANLTKRQLAEKIKEHLNNLVIISSEIGIDPDKRDYLVSNEKLENKGWKPEVSIDDGIEELISAARLVPKKIGSNV